MNAVPAPAAEKTVSMLDHALKYASQDWPVFPCRKNKTPYTAHGYKDATTDEDQIRAWWSRWPDASIGVPTGERTQVIALDVDLPKLNKKTGTYTADGRDVLKELEKEHGPLPRTMEVKTGSGGRHLFFVYPPGSGLTTGSKTPCEGLDFRGQGGYVIFPPSGHPSGKRYEWVVTDRIVHAPAWWIDAISKKAEPEPSTPKAEPKKAATTPKAGSTTNYGEGALADAFDRLASTSPGGRNEQLFREAASLSELVAGGEIASKVEVENTLMTAMQENGYVADKGEAPVWKTLNSGISKGMQKPRTAPPKKPKKESGQADAAPKEGKASPQRAAMLAVLDRLGGADSLIHFQGFFWRWTGKCWRRCDDLEIKKVIQEVESNNEKYTAAFCNGVFSLLQNQVVRSAESGFQFDSTESRDIYVENCVLHFNGTGWETRPHVREDYRTTLLPVTFDVAATAPRFRQYLDEVFEPDADREEKKCLLLEAIGYTIYPGCEFNKYIILYGEKAGNGKTVTTNVVESLVGERNRCSVEPSQFSNKFQVAHLQGKLLNVVSELKEGASIADEVLKKISDGGTFTAEFKNKPAFEFRPIATMWFTTNFLPQAQEINGVLRRALLIPYNRRFEEHEQDPNLDRKLAAEKSGILNMALSAFAGVLLRGSFTNPPSCRAAKDDWRTVTNDVAVFIDEKLVRSKRDSIKGSDLYLIYKIWCEDAGIKKPLARHVFSQRMVAQGAVVKQEGKERTRVLYGFALNGGGE